MDSVRNILEKEVKNCSSSRMGLLITLVLIAFGLGLAAIIMVSVRTSPESFVGKLPESKFQPVATDPYLVGAKQNPQIDQPQAFEHELLSSGCLPHVGCLYPMPNPINIKTGRRDDEIPQGVQVRTCSKAWRDCPAFANCEDGECKPQPNLYRGF